MKSNLFKNGFLVVLLTMVSSSSLFAFTAVTDGDWTDPATWGGVAPSGTVSNQDIIIPSGIDVNMNTDVTFSGLLNNFTVDGTLMSTANNRLTIELGTFGGNGDIDIQRIIFDGLLITYAHTGDLTVKTFVNMGAVVAITSQVSVSDSLDLDAGTFTLNTGGNLMLETDAIIVRNSGSIATTGGVFNAGGAYHVRYEGGSKTTGIEINSTNLQNVEIDLDNNTTTLTMGSNFQVYGDLTLSTGILSVGANDLELYGNVDIETGAMLTTIATSSVRIETATPLTSALVFTSGSSVEQLSINYTATTGSVELESNLAIAGELQLHSGVLSVESGAILTMNTGSLVQVMEGELEGNGGTFVGTASYDVEYIGDTTVTTGLEVTGTGLNDVQVNIGEGQVVMESDITVGGELELSSGKLNLNANDLVLNGTLNQDEESPIIGDMNSDLHLNMTMVGDDTIYFDEDYMDLEQWIVDVTGGDIVLGTGLHIHDELTMMNGNVVLMDENLVIEEDADITGYTNTRYVVTPDLGMLQMRIIVSTPFVLFPVGTENNYSPASLQQGAGGTSGNFTVRAFEGVYIGGTEDSGFNSAMITSVVNNTWIVEADGTSLDLNMKLGWELAAEVNAFDRTNAYISHFDGSWDEITSSAAVTGANSTYEITRMGITTLSPFSVADEDAELIVDEAVAIDLNLYPNPSTDIMNIDYKNTNGDQYIYEVTDLAGRTYTVLENGNNQLDVSALGAGVYVLKMINVETNALAVKRFIKN